MFLEKLSDETIFDFMMAYSHDPYALAVFLEHGKKWDGNYPILRWVRIFNVTQDDVENSVLIRDFETGFYFAPVRKQGNGLYQCSNLAIGRVVDVENGSLLFPFDDYKLIITGYLKVHFAHGVTPLGNRKLWLVKQ